MVNKSYEQHPKANRYPEYEMPAQPVENTVGEDEIIQRDTFLREYTKDSK